MVIDLYLLMNSILIKMKILIYPSIIFGLVFFFTKWLITMPDYLSFYLSCLISLIFTLIYVKVDDYRLSFKYIINSRYLEIFYILFSLISIFIYFNNDINIFILDWSNISIYYWLRLLFTYIILFMMGFQFITLVQGERVYGLITFVLSFIIGAFFFTLILFFNILFFLRFNYTINNNYLIILVFNILSLYNYFKYKNKNNKINLDLSIIDMLLIFMILLFSISCSIIPELNKYPLHSGDQWGEIGEGYRFAVRKIDSYDFTGEYWYALFLGSYFIMCGLPYINSFLSLFPLASLSVICFYILGKTFYKSKNIGVLSAFTSLFLGFGWILFIILRNQTEVVGPFFNQVANLTHDLHRGIFGVVPLTLSHNTLFGVTIFLTLISLTFNNTFKKNTSIISIIILIFFGYVIHSAYVIIFILIYLTYFILFPNEKRNNILKYPYVFSFGILLVILFDNISMYQWYTIRSYVLPTYISLLIGIVVIIISKFNLKINILQISIPTKISYIIIFIFVLVYTSLIYLYITIYKYIIFSNSSIDIILYPIIYGVTGLFSLIFIILNISKKINYKNYTYLFSIIISLLIINIIRIIYPQLIYNFNQNRILFFLHVPLVIFTAIIADNLLHSKNIILNIQFNKKTKSYNIYNIKTCIIILIIGISGISSTLLSVNGWYLSRINVSFSDISAAKYISDNIKPNESIFTISDYYSNQLMRLVGIQPSIQAFGGSQNSLLLTPKKIGTIYDMISKLNLKYIYLRQQDSNILKNQYKNSMITNLIKLLYGEVYNSTIISKIPSLSGPKNSDFYICPIDSSIIIDDQYNGNLSSYKLINGNWYLNIINDNRILKEDSKIFGNKILLINNSYLPEYFFSINFNSTNNFNGGLVFNYKNNDDYYIYRFRSDVGYVYCEHIVKNNISLIFSSKFTSSLNSWNNLKIFVSNKYVDFYINEKKLFQYNFNEVTLGYVGLVNLSSIASFDNLLLEKRYNIWESEIFPISIFSLGGYTYDINYVRDYIPNNSSIILLTNYPGDLLFQKYLEWVKTGKTLIVFNNDNVIYNSLTSFLDIKYSSEKINATSIFYNGNLEQIPSIEVIKNYSNSSNVSVLSYYLANNDKSPLTYFKTINNGKIFYINTNAYFYNLLSNINDSYLNNMNVTNEKFIKLPILIKNIDIFKEEINENKKINYISYFEGDISFTGIANVSSTDIIYPKNGIPIIIGEESASLLGIDNEKILYNFQSSKINIINEVNGYTGIKFFNATILIPHSNNLLIKYKNGTIIQINLSEQYPIKLEDNTILFFKKINITINGIITYDKLSYYLPGAVLPYLIVKENSFIEGLINMSISYSDYNLHILDNFLIK